MVSLAVNSPLSDNKYLLIYKGGEEQVVGLPRGCTWESFTPPCPTVGFNSVYFRAYGPTETLVHNYSNYNAELYHILLLLPASDCRA